MASITVKQARELSDTFRELSKALESYRKGHAKTLRPEQKKAIETAEFDLLNHSSDLITKAVGLTLNNIQGGLAALKGATTDAKNAIGTVQKVKTVINIATALVGLGAVIATKNPSAIATALTAMKDLLAPPKDSGKRSAGG